MILVVIGCPCVGKTSVCNELRNWGFETLKIDDFFEHGKSKYDPEHSREAYRRMFESLGDGDYAVDTPGNAPAFLAGKKQLVHYTTVKLEAPWEDILERYQNRWQADDIPPWKLKEEFEDAKRLRADMVIDTTNILPKDVAKVIVQRLKHRESSADTMHKEIYRHSQGLERKNFLDHLMGEME